MQTTGWLFDLYPLHDRMVLWFITEGGQRLRLEDDFPYCLYLGGPQARLRFPGPDLGPEGLAAPGLSVPGPGFVDRTRRSRWWPWRSRPTASCRR